ncbi:MAG: MFS transporter [Patescibacteria group bacterium]
MKNIILLGLTSLLADFSSEMIQPLMPFFIISLGGAGIAVGLIGGTGDALAAVFKVFSGRLADQSKKYKKFVYFGYGFSAISKFLFPLAATWSHILILRPIERIGKGLRDAPRDAIISESNGGTAEKRGFGFGVQRAMDSVGAIIGSIVAYILFVNLGVSFRYIFLIAAIIALTALIPIFFVKEPRSLTERKINHKKFSFKNLSPQLKRFILTATVFNFANFNFMFFILKAGEVFKDIGGIGLPILLYIFFSVFDASLSAPAGRLSDKIGRQPVLTIGYLLFAVTSFGFIFADSLFALMGLFALYGAFRAFIDASQRAFVSDLSPIEDRAVSLGIFEMSIGLALIPAGLIAGFLWNIDPAYTFVYGSGLSLIALAAFLLTVKSSRVQGLSH